MAKRKKKKTAYKKIYMKWAIYLASSIVSFFLLLYLLVFIGFFGRIPSVENLRNIQNYLASEVFSSDQTLLGKYYIENRTNVAYNDIPDYLIKALIATEDERFYQHNGIDQRSMLRVLVKSILLQKESSGGGSTISQQLAKNLFPRRNYFIISMPVNKIREMITAVRLEKAYKKQDILELYLNTVSFGENTYGIETASRRFFGKRPRDLKVEEAAVLIGMLKATNLYNPQTQPENAINRRNTVLSQMVKNNYMEKSKADSLKKLPIKLNYTRITHNEGPAPYFREHLRLELMEWCNENPRPDGSKYNIYTDGLKIYTTINADLQKYAEESMRGHMKHLQELFNRDPWGRDDRFLENAIKKSSHYKQLKKEGKNHDEIIKEMRKPVKMQVFTWDGKTEKTMSPIDSIKHYLKFMNAGLLAMESKTGYIRAWVGGINHEYFQYDHVTAKRQPGSVFKPFVYTAALENGHTPCQYIPNDSVTYTDYDDWTPRNADRSYGGYYSMKGGLTHSVNTISVHLLMETGFTKLKDLTGRLEIGTDLPEVPSVALGTYDVSLFEMVRAYSVFANNGKLVEPIYLRRIEDRFGNVLYESKPQPAKQMLDANVAQTVTEMLKGVVNDGTAASLRSVYGFDNEIAGKTGTTQQNTDGWFIGYTPDLVTGVWVGGDNPVIRFRSMSYGQGSYSALPVWARFMQKIYYNPLYKFSKYSSFNIPEDIKNTMDCPDYKEEEFQTLKDILDKKGETIIEFFKRIFKKREPSRNDNDSIKLNTR